MSTSAAPAPAALPLETSAPGNPTKVLTVGVIASLVVLAGAFLPGNAHAVAMAWLVGVSFWTAVTIGMLLLVMIHHITDASWSVVLRRQWEHATNAFKYLFVLFLPLIIASWVGQHDIVWPWMNLSHEVHGGHTVGEDILYLKKESFLNFNMFVGMTVAFFAIWVGVSARLKKASFAQDVDGDPKWTKMNRQTSAYGLPLTALALTGAAIYWIKSLEYHWFSTMYGVWFFANCMRGGFSITALLMIWLYNRGDYKGIINTHTFHSIGQWMLAFTVFWAYVTFSQYFLIWNANVPEETFWYNIREINADGSPNQWKYVGIIIILFGHFVVPFLYLLSYKHKVVHAQLKRIAIWIPCVILFDLCYNILPALKNEHGDPQPFLSMTLVWTLASVIGVGGICIYAYLKNFPTTKLIPIRDPRIGECLTHHE